jgi:hypothetical protein
MGDDAMMDPSTDSAGTDTAATPDTEEGDGMGEEMGLGTEE